jgi:hypothetical protein
MVKGFVLSGFLLLWMPLLVLPQESFEVFEIPTKYIVPLDNVDYKDDGENFEGTYWEVFSDRMYNNTTSRPGGGSTMKHLDYLEKFFVIGRKGSSLRIARDHQPTETGEPGEELEDYGWIDMDNLLVWRHCLVDEETRLDKRAIVVKTEKTRGLFLETTDGPGMEPVFKIFYIYKDNKTSYLLGTSPRIPPSSADISNYLISSVPKDNLYLWNDTRALEPDCRPAQVSIRRESGIESCIMDSKGLAKRFQKKPNAGPSGVIWSADTCSGPLSGGIMRFPILDQSGSVATVVVFSGSKLNADEIANGAYEGYAVMVTGDDVPLFRKVVLMSKAHLSRVISLYEMIMFEGSDLEDRARFIQMFTDMIIDAHQGLDREDILEMSISDIHNLVFQYRGSNTLPEETELQALLGPGELSDENLQAYLNSFRPKHRELNDIFNYQAAEHIFESNGLTYYWIPAELLP